MGRDQEEPNRVLGFPVRGDRWGRPSGPVPGSRPPGQISRGRPHSHGEPQRVLGFPVDWLRLPSREVLARLMRPVRELRRARRG